MKCGVSSRAKSVVAGVLLLCKSSPIRSARPISGLRPNTDIARELHVSETTIRKRVSQLVSRGLINIVAGPKPPAPGGKPAAVTAPSGPAPQLRGRSGGVQREEGMWHGGGVP